MIKLLEGSGMRSKQISAKIIPVRKETVLKLMSGTIKQKNTRLKLFSSLEKNAKIAFGFYEEKEVAKLLRAAFGALRERKFGQSEERLASVFWRMPLDKRESASSLRQ